MAGITLADAQTQLSEALTALSAARKTYRYAIGTRSLERQRLSEANADVEKWNKIVGKLDRGGIPIIGITTN